MVFNYLGQFDQVVAGSKLFRFAASRPARGTARGSAAARARNQLPGDRRPPRDVGGRTMHGSHDRGRRSSALADDVPGRAQRADRPLPSPEAGGRTPSDFPLARVGSAGARSAVGATSRTSRTSIRCRRFKRCSYSARSRCRLAAFDQWQCTLRGALECRAFQRAWQTRCGATRSCARRFTATALREPLQMVHRDVAAAVDASKTGAVSPPTEQRDALGSLLDATARRR